MQVLLGVAIGLVLTFAVMSVVVSSVMELISGVTRMRGTRSSKASRGCSTINRRAAASLRTRRRCCSIR